MLLNSECTKSLTRWPSQSTIPSLFCQRPFECHLLYTSWWHQIAHYSLVTLFCKTEWQFTCAQLCITIRYKPFGLIQVSKDFRSVRIAHMKGNFVRGAPWIMQWQSGFAGLAEINMILNKETRWNCWFYLAEEEVKKLGFREQLLKAMMHKGHMCLDANFRKKDLSYISEVYIILYLPMHAHNTAF